MRPIFSIINRDNPHSYHLKDFMVLKILDKKGRYPFLKKERRVLKLMITARNDKRSTVILKGIHMLINKKHKLVSKNIPINVIEKIFLDNNFRLKTTFSTPYPKRKLINT